MKFKDIELNDENHFVGMEYYFLILNRTFLIIKINNNLIGILGNGMISTEGGKDILTRKITSSLAVKGDLTNPNTYLKNKYLEKIDDVDLLDGSILNENKANFIIKIKDIKEVKYNSNKKFGMGAYPHDGRITIETHNNNKIREFIILGNQSGQKISNWI